MQNVPCGYNTSAEAWKAEANRLRELLSRARDALGSKAAHWHVLKDGSSEFFYLSRSECPGCAEEEKVAAIYAEIDKELGVAYTEGTS